MMLDLMQGYGRPCALLLLCNVDDGVVAYCGGRRVSLTTDRWRLTACGR